MHRAAHDRTCNNRPPTMLTTHATTGLGQPGSSQPFPTDIGTTSRRINHKEHEYIVGAEPEDTCRESARGVVCLVAPGYIYIYYLDESEIHPEHRHCQALSTPAAALAVPAPAGRFLQGFCVQCGSIREQSSTGRGTFAGIGRGLSNE